MSGCTRVNQRQFMNKSQVSVVIPAHNGARYLSDAINSVLRQTCVPGEIIVVDNGSTDDTEKVAKSFPEITYHRLSEACVASARQYGIEQSAGAFIAFLDQDDLWLPDKLVSQIRYLNEHPDSDCVIGQQMMFLEPEMTKPHWVKTSLLGIPLPGYLPSALMLRRTILAKTGAFDASFALVSDVAWFFKVRHMGLQIGSVDQVVVHKRIHTQNESGQVRSCQDEILRVIKQFLIARRAGHA